MSYRRFIYFLMFIILIITTIFSGYNLAKASAIDTIETNLKTSIADIIMIVATCALIIIGAIDARIAVMSAFLVYASIFIVFTLATEEGIANFNPYYSGVATMACFVIICLMLLISYKKSNTPYNVV